MTLEFDGQGVTTPEARAAVMGAMVKYVAGLTQPATFSALLYHLMDEFNAKEEEIGHDVHRAYFILAMSGVFISNDCSPEEGSASIGAGTTVGPSRRITDYVWTGPENWKYDPDADD